MANKTVFVIGAALLVLACVGSSTALGKTKRAAKAPISGEAIFKTSCAECHSGGGNSVKAHKPVAGSEKLSTEAVFKSYLTSPVGHMPYYQHIVKDKAMLHALYDYCKTLKPATQS
jgi:mono/diheme cytochrome c family protein